jgi:DNA-binding transcriptional LysR family regulator
LSMTWDDLRVFLAVRRHGSHARASRALGVDPTTVGRRVAALEEALGARLFRRHRAGLAATLEGVRLAERVELIESEVLASARELGSRRCLLDGPVRVTANDGILTSVLAPSLGELLTHNPGLRLELRGGAAGLDLSPSQADVAIRLSRPKQPTLVARRLGLARFALFASEAYVARRGRPTSEDALAEHALITCETAFERSPHMTWLLSRAGRDVRIRCDSTAAMVAACVAGQGIAIAIAPAMRALPGIVAVLPRARIPTRVVWGVAHADVQRNARVKAVLDWAASALVASGMGPL